MPGFLPICGSYGASGSMSERLSSRTATIFGDGVNIAVRLEGLASPGGICVSARVQEDAAGKIDVVFEDLGEQRLHNITRAVRVYQIGSGVASRPSLPLPDKPSIAILAFTNMSGDAEQEFLPTGSPKT
jgi:adenylate cyclase